MGTGKLGSQTNKQMIIIVACPPKISLLEEYKLIETNALRILERSSSVNLYQYLSFQIKIVPSQWLGGAPLEGLKT